MLLKFHVNIEIEKAKKKVFMLGNVEIELEKNSNFPVAHSSVSRYPIS